MLLLFCFVFVKREFAVDLFTSNSLVVGDCGISFSDSWRFTLVVWTVYTPARCLVGVFLKKFQQLSCCCCVWEGGGAEHVAASNETAIVDPQWKEAASALFRRSAIISFVAHTHTHTLPSQIDVYSRNHPSFIHVFHFTRPHSSPLSGSRYFFLSYTAVASYFLLLLESFVIIARSPSALSPSLWLWQFLRFVFFSSVLLLQFFYANLYPVPRILISCSRPHTDSEKPPFCDYCLVSGVLFSLSPLYSHSCFQCCFFSYSFTVILYLLVFISYFDVSWKKILMSLCVCVCL